MVLTPFLAIDEESPIKGRCHIKYLKALCLMYI